MNSTSRSGGPSEPWSTTLAGVTGRILEPATGTGRVLIPLLEAGFAVEGLDSSPEMLAVCRQHCRDRGLDPILREADMTAFVAGIGSGRNQAGSPSRWGSAGTGSGGMHHHPFGILVLVFIKHNSEEYF